MSKELSETLQVVRDAKARKERLLLDINAAFDDPRPSA